MKKLLYSILALAWMCGVGWGASISTLTDNFDDNSIDAAKWSSYVGSGTLSETNKQLELATALGGSEIYFYGVNDYDLTSSSASIKIVDAGNQSLNSYNFQPIHLENAGGDKLYFYISNEYIEASQIVSSNYTLIASATYVAATHRYLRIRESSGYIYFEYSATGLTGSWNTLGSVATSLTITSLNPQIIIGSTAEASTTTAKIDDFNILPSESESAPIYSHAFSSGFNEGFNDGLN